MSEMNQTWVLRQRPVGDIKEGDLELVETPLEPLKDGEIRIDLWSITDADPDHVVVGFDRRFVKRFGLAFDDSQSALGAFADAGAQAVAQVL